MCEAEEKTIWKYLGMEKMAFYDLPQTDKCAVKTCNDPCMNKNDYLCFKHRKGFTIWRNSFVLKALAENKRMKEQIATFREDVEQKIWAESLKYRKTVAPASNEEYEIRNMAIVAMRTVTQYANEIFTTPLSAKLAEHGERKQ